MWEKTVALLAAHSGLPLTACIGQSLTAYFDDNKSIVLEVPEDIVSKFQLGLIILEFGNILEHLLGRESFAKNWQNRFKDICAGIYANTISV